MTEQPDRQFDFWLGDWDATWQDDGKGENHVTLSFNGKVVQENFTAPDLIGMSVSVYDVERKLWCQTWVDNSGSYLDFTGGFQNRSMILARNAIVKGQACKQKMIWYNIEADQFDWNWERSDDDSETWHVLWQIKYTRKK